MKKLLNTIKSAAWFILPLGFLLSLYGYICVGNVPILEAIYATCALYFISPVTDVNNIYVTVGKLIAMAASASILLSVLSSVTSAIRHRWLQRWADSTAVYTDNNLGKQLAAKLKHGYIGGSGQIERTRSHMIMYTGDIANLEFYNANKAAFGDSDVYIMLNEVDPFLMDRPDRISSNVRFFNLNDLMARTYWQQYSLYDAVRKSSEPMRIAVIGYGKVGKAICRYAVLNNIFSVDQAVEYHIWGCGGYNEEHLSGINTMNGDRFVIHHDDIYANAALLESMHRIIVTEESDIELLQFLLYNTAKPEIHHYSDTHVMDKIYASTRFVTFGIMEELLSEECIKEEKLLRAAKLINYDYNHMGEARLPESQNALTAGDEAAIEQEWSSLNGFTRGSNIARADHYRIELQLAKDGACIEELQKLEHTRWCRYHFYNHWSFAPIAKKDAANRLHPLLKPYKELTEEQKKLSGMANRLLHSEIEKIISEQEN